MRVPTAERIEELLEEIYPPTTGGDFVEEVAETAPRWPVTVFTLACLVVVVIVWMVFAPAAREDPVAVRQRIESDIQTLAQLVERYHAEARSYPDAATWQMSSDRGDPRFVDPWRRPYRYRLSRTAFSITSYGADQQRGGGGLNMDIELSFPRTRIDGERTPIRSTDEDSA